MKPESREEIELTVLWFISLREVIEDGDTDTALASIDAALKLIDRQKKEVKLPEAEG